MQFSNSALLFCSLPLASIHPLYFFSGLFRRPLVSREFLLEIQCTPNAPEAIVHYPLSSKMMVFGAVVCISLQWLFCFMTLKWAGSPLGLVISVPYACIAAFYYSEAVFSDKISAIRASYWIYGKSQDYSGRNELPTDTGKRWGITRVGSLAVGKASAFLIIYYMLCVVFFGLIRPNLNWPGVSPADGYIAVLGSACALAVIGCLLRRERMRIMRMAKS